jgi:hypothetical protein
MSIGLNNHGCFSICCGSSVSTGLTIISPTAICLVTGTDFGLITGCIPFLGLDGTNQIDLFHAARFKTKLFCHFPYFLHLHETSLPSRYSFHGAVILMQR